MESEQRDVVSKETKKEVYHFSDGINGVGCDISIYDDGSLYLYDWFNSRKLDFTKEEALALIRLLCVGYDLPIQFPHDD